ncbi:hypothetical protein STCU_10724 [Strigomonas culicis]|uniref:Clu domain-containing protein n=1 Tax=Strigomonas culicis TaxID=28005 RepID=S9TK92_9TRYP|nr:hypothetical protein STCU_10724 [Strigomonas culicis]|eukprot:EPY17254.1 hypothetical protein STCU_10724 [Strigomonas culicis]
MGSESSVEQKGHGRAPYDALSLPDEAPRQAPAGVRSLRKRHRRRGRMYPSPSSPTTPGDLTGTAEMGLLAQHQREMTLSGQLFDVRPPKMSADHMTIEKDFTASYLDACYRALAGEDTAKAFGPNDIFQLTVSSWDAANYQASQAALEGVVATFYHDTLQVVTAVIDWEDSLCADRTSDLAEREMSSSRSRSYPLATELRESTLNYAAAATGECSVLSDAMLHYTVTHGRVVVRQGFFFFFWSSCLGEKVGSLECRSSRWVQQASVSHVHVPLHYHYRYRGRGVTVISLAPISETLTSVTEQSGEVAAMAQQLASAFSLTPYCGSADQETAADHPRMVGNPNYEMSPDYSFMPKDVYVHFGRDGRYYFIQNRRWFPPWLSGRLATNGQSLTLSEFSLLSPQLLSSKGVHLSCRSFAPDAFISENLETLHFMKYEIDRGMQDLLSRVREAPLERAQREKRRRAAQQKLQQEMDFARSHGEVSVSHTTAVTLESTNTEEAGQMLSANPFTASVPLCPTPAVTPLTPQALLTQSGGHSTMSSSALDLVQETLASLDETEDAEAAGAAPPAHVNLYYTGNIVSQFDRMGYPKRLLGALYLTLIQFPSAPRHMLFELKREILFRGIKEYILCRAYETRFPDLHARGALADLGDHDDGAYVDEDGAPIFGLVDQYGIDGDSDATDEEYALEETSSESCETLFLNASAPFSRTGLLDRLKAFAASVRHVARLFMGRPHVVTATTAAANSPPSHKKRRSVRAGPPPARGVCIGAAVANPLPPELGGLARKERPQAEKSHHLYANMHFFDLVERTLVAFMQYDGRELPQHMYFRGNLDEKEVWEEAVTLNDLYNDTILPFVYHKFHIPFNAAPDLKLPLGEADKAIVHERLCAAFGMTVVDGRVTSCVPTVKDFSPHRRRPDAAPRDDVDPSAASAEGAVYEVPRWIRLRTMQLLRLLMRHDATHREWDLYGAALIPFLTIQRDCCRSDEAVAGPGRHRLLPPLSKMLPTLVRQVTNMSTAPVLLWHLLEQDSVSLGDEDCRHLGRNYRSALGASSSVAGGFLNGLEMAAAQRREQLNTLADRCLLIQVLRRQVHLLSDMEGLPTLPVTNLPEECGRPFHVCTMPTLRQEGPCSLPEEAVLAKLLACLSEVVHQADLVLHQLGSPFSLQYHRFTAELLSVRRSYPVEVHCGPASSDAELQDGEAVLQHMLSTLQTFCSQDLYAAQDALHRGVQLFNRAIARAALTHEAALHAEVQPDVGVELCLRNAAELFIGLEGLHSPHTVRTLANLALYFHATGQHDAWRECVWRLRLLCADDAPEDIRALLQTTQTAGANSALTNWYRSGSHSSMKNSSSLNRQSVIPLVVLAYEE